MTTGKLYVSMCDTKLGKIQVLSLSPDCDIVRLDLLDFMSYFVRVSRPAMSLASEISNEGPKNKDPDKKGPDKPDKMLLPKILNSCNPHNNAPASILNDFSHLPDFSEPLFSPSASLNYSSFSPLSTSLPSLPMINRVEHLFPAYLKTKGCEKSLDNKEDKKILSFLNKYKISAHTEIVLCGDNTFSLYLNTYLNEKSLDKKVAALSLLQSLCAPQPAWIEALKNIPIGSVVSYNQFKDYIDYTERQKYTLSPHLFTGATQEQISTVSKQVSKKIYNAGLLAPKLLQNDIPLIFPCHRVVPQDAIEINETPDKTGAMCSAQFSSKIGEVGNYVFGAEAKRALLDLEGIEITK